jgi:hypothetical protein
MTSAARLPTPVMVAEPVTGHRERGHHLVDAAVQGGDGAFQMLQVVKGQPDQQPMVLAEAAPQRLAQLGELLAQLALGQLRQDLGVAFAGDQGRQHRPARDAQDVSGDRDLLDAGVLQGLLDPLALGAMGLEGAACGSESDPAAGGSPAGARSCRAAAHTPAAHPARRHHRHRSCGRAGA